ncbi:hypothetical protein FRA_44c12240 [Francisella sp. W12-1067]|nr:hypothetical protein FRA_44c12240 [Francisella sp. W12-1067]
MKINSDELLALGSALVQSVRTYIPYSQNIDLLNKDYGNTDLCKYNSNLLSTHWGKYCNIGSKGMLYERAKNALNIGVGNCSDLTLACLYIAAIASEIIKLQGRKFYLSLIQFSGRDHAVALIHQYKGGIGDDISYELEAIIEDKDFDNAIIVDPWIYKATKLSDFALHFDHASLYGVQGNFISTNESETDEIEFMKIDITIPLLPQDKEDILSCKEEQKYIETFAKFYEEQRNKLNAIGRRCDSVEKDLMNKAIYFDKQVVKIQLTRRNYLESKQTKLRKQNQLIISLKSFFNALLRQWYNVAEYNNKKGRILTSVIKYLEDCSRNKSYPSRYKINQIFWRTLTVLATLEDFYIEPKNLSRSTIHQSKLARCIFNSSVVPESKLDLEQIGNLNLDWVRRARNETINISERYGRLLDMLKYNIPDFSLKKLYNNQQNYCDLVQQALLE